MVDEHVVDFLFAHPGHPVRIDIGNSILSVEGYGEFSFPIDPFSAYCLTRGINQLEFLLENEAEINRYEQAWPSRQTGK